MFTGLLSPLLVIYFISSLVPTPPPFMRNYVCTDLPAVGLVNHAHLASCRQNCQEGGWARGTRVYIFFRFGMFSKKKKIVWFSFFYCRLARVSRGETWTLKTHLCAHLHSHAGSKQRHTRVSITCMHTHASHTRVLMLIHRPKDEGRCFFTGLVHLFETLEELNF